VASFVNPHDISFSSFGWAEILGFDPPDDTVPDIPEPPSQSDSFAGRPACQEQFLKIWPQAVIDQPSDAGYRRLYYYLHKLVDRAIGRILEALDRSGMADDTIVVFTSDHGDLLGAHGGLQQKWYNAFDEAIRVPLLVRGPGISTTPTGLDVPTSHVDLLPTLLGLAGIDVEQAAAGVAEHHEEAQALPGRDLSDMLTGTTRSIDVAPIYFLTEDDVTSGLDQANVLSGKPFDNVAPPGKVESVIATLPTGTDGADELWKLNHYYERLDDWYADKGFARNPFAGPAADPVFELHNLSTDPEERKNRAADADSALMNMKAVLDAERDVKRLVPAHRNP
jgi:arylsulfatase A-like enzyme